MADKLEQLKQTVIAKREHGIKVVYGKLNARTAVLDWVIKEIEKLQGEE